MRVISACDSTVPYSPRTSTRQTTRLHSPAYESVGSPLALGLISLLRASQRSDRFCASKCRTHLAPPELASPCHGTARSAPLVARKDPCLSHAPRHIREDRTEPRDQYRKEPRDQYRTEHGLRQGQDGLPAGIPRILTGRVPRILTGRNPAHPHRQGSRASSLARTPRIQNGQTPAHPLGSLLGIATSRRRRASLGFCELRDPRAYSSAGAVRQ